MKGHLHTSVTSYHITKLNSLTYNDNNTLQTRGHISRFK